MHKPINCDALISAADNQPTTYQLQSDVLSDVHSDVYSDVFNLIADWWATQSKSKMNEVQKMIDTKTARGRIVNAV